MRIRLYATAERACERYGPARLPLSGRRDVGGGYAAATSALVASLAFVLATLVASLVEGVVTALAMFGAVAVPVAVPVAFVSGLLTWRHLPERTPHFGAVAGLITTLLTYVLGGFAVALVILVGGLVGLPPASGAASIQGPIDLASTYLTYSLGVAVLSFAFTFWLTLPVGAVGGHVHEQVRLGPHSGRRKRDSDGPIVRQW